MSTLTEKRRLIYNNKLSQNVNLSGNTDEIEPKLDLIISNTNHNSISGSMNSTLIAGGNVQSSTVDIGINSGIYKFQWSGSETNQNVDYLIETSNDGVTFHPYPSAIALKLNGYISIEYDMVFRYHRLNVKNTHGSDGTTLSLVFSGRH